jgi:hypothetical protein
MRAATEARDAVRLRNVADAFSEIVRTAKQVEVWTTCERYTEASVQLGEFMLHLAENRAEFDRFLAVDADTLRNAEFESLQLAEELRKDGLLLPRMSNQEMLSKWQKVEIDLSAILGKMRKNVYKEKQ